MRISLKVIGATMPGLLGVWLLVGSVDDRIVASDRWAIVLAIVLGLVSLTWLVWGVWGLVRAFYQWGRCRRMRDPVPGEAYVVSAVMSRHCHGLHTRYSMEVVVGGGGVPPTRATRTGLVRNRTGRYPAIGMTLPVTVDRADPTRFTVNWSQAPDRYGHPQRILADMVARLGENASAPGSGTAGDTASRTWTQRSGRTVRVNGKDLDLKDFPGLNEGISGLMDGLPALPGKRLSGLNETFRALGANIDRLMPAGEMEIRLHRLEELQRRGVITESEYRTHRQAILNRL